MKDERQGPTGSFKDRQAALAISVMKEHGITEAVVASTGNVAISYSAYSALAGIKMWAFLTSLVPAEKMREVALYGTRGDQGDRHLRSDEAGGGRFRRAAGAVPGSGDPRAWQPARA